MGSDRWGDRSLTLNLVARAKVTCLCSQIFYLETGSVARSFLITSKRDLSAPGERS